MALNFTAADRVGGIGGYIGGIATLLGMAGNGGILNGCGVPEGDHVVNRYEAGQAAEIAALKSDIKLRDANTYTDSKILEMYQYLDGRLRGVEGQISAQAVVNAQITANISCMQNQIATLSGLTKTVIPIGNVCPEPMPAKNSWTAPTAAAST
jgi:hypothetical protein